MPRITRVYTRTGDHGETRLGTGEKVPKDALRVEAYGEVDELNAVLGRVLCENLAPEIRRAVEEIQHTLFHLGADLCVPEADKEAKPVPRVADSHVRALESLMDRLGAHLGPLENFILPGGCPVAAWLHLARTVCRRAERRVVRLARAEPVNPEAVRFLNRLSDALFVFARWENHRRGIPDVLWDSRR